MKLKQIRADQAKVGKVYLTESGIKIKILEKLGTGNVVVKSLSTKHQITISSSYPVFCKVKTK